MSSILGISAFYHDSAAAIIKDGKIVATFEIAWLTGWKYHESQQKPLKRGSGMTNMVEGVKKFE